MEGSYKIGVRKSFSVCKISRHICREAVLHTQYYVSNCS